MPPTHPRWKEIDQKLDDDDHARIVVRHVELLAPVPANGSTKNRKSASGGEQIPRDQFTCDSRNRTASLR